ncbi:interferon regulatory factor 4-like isoform X1 [Monodelphis domestica]|uniref:interferon regulatory factor 4-like isoform X1 n=1 Tax=Monodelphis domestica TaxID=13616 RepID=UPI0024E201C1|nr:interferon regulatory factor 4-like isoform X1 [Monodelphis domestica]
MAEPGGPLRLREWLVAQIESGHYPGLRWENREKTMFRIPWKHAAKQDYRQQQDAALFRAWAIYKGKYQEGTDKADPSVWKTRLRCALNKSTDFQEVIDRSQLDISEPYKVYQIISEGICNLEDEGQQGRLRTPQDLSAEPLQRPDQAGSDSAAEEIGKERIPKGCHQVPPAPCFTSSKAEPGYQVTGTFYSWDPSQSHLPPSLTPWEDVSNSDCWLHIRLYYRDVLVKEAIAYTAEGCRLTTRPVPMDSPHLYGPAKLEQIHFPSPHSLPGASPPVTQILERLLPHLDKGVLLWVAPEGVFAKRQCQGRVYWRGPLAPHCDQPNKLEREKTYKLLDTQQFLDQLRRYLSLGEPAPQYQIQLCFGEEYPGPSCQSQGRLIMAHVSLRRRGQPGLFPSHSRSQPQPYCMILDKSFLSGPQYYLSHKTRKLN